MSVWPVLLTIAVLSGISMVFGDPASFWFALGGLTTVLLVLWEEGGRKRRERTAEKTPSNESRG